MLCRNNAYVIIEKNCLSCFVADCNRNFDNVANKIGYGHFGNIAVIAVISDGEFPFGIKIIAYKTFYIINIEEFFVHIHGVGFAHFKNFAFGKHDDKLGISGVGVAVEENMVTVHTCVISENFFSVGNSCYSNFAGSEFNVGSVHNNLESGETGSKGLAFVTYRIELNVKIFCGYIMGVGSCASGYGKHNENKAEHYGKHFFHIDKHPFCISNGHYNIKQIKNQTYFPFIA